MAYNAYYVSNGRKIDQVHASKWMNDEKKEKKTPKSLPSQPIWICIVCVRIEREFRKFAINQYLIALNLWI